MHPTTPATSLEPSSWPSAHCPTLSPARPYPPQRGPLRMRCCRPAWRATASMWRRRASPKSSPRCLPRERRATQRVHRSRGCRLSAGRRHERARRVSWSCVARAAYKICEYCSASAEFPPFSNVTRAATCASPRGSKRCCPFRGIPCGDRSGLTRSLHVRGLHVDRCCGSTRRCRRLALSSPPSKATERPSQ